MPLRLTPDHASDYRQLMLEAYTAEPTAFTSSAEDREGLPLGWWRQRLGEQEENLSRVFGVMQNDRLVAVVGVKRNPGAKVRHKATLFGMFTSPEYRGRGFARKLLKAATLDASQERCLRQLNLTVTEGNEAAIGLYKQEGFTIFGKEPGAILVANVGYSKLHMAKYF